jgi:hypothetical protein
LRTSYATPVWREGVVDSHVDQHECCQSIATDVECGCGPEVDTAFWLAIWCGPPTQIPTAAPASGGRKRPAQWAKIAPASTYLLGSIVTSDALDDRAYASVIAIPLPRAPI